MRVGIEAASLALTSGGLARYTGELSLALARCFPSDEFVLLSDQRFTMPATAPPNLTHGGAPRNAIERRWWIWGLERELRRLSADLIHGPDFAVPYIPRRPSVLTIHDLSPWMDSSWHHAASRVRRRTPLLLELGIPTMVITPAESVRKQAIERFGLVPERVVAIPEAAPNWLRSSETLPTATPYFLFVGTLEPRKNIPLLIDVWRAVRQQCLVDLVIAGRKRADCPPIPTGEPGLRLMGEVPDADLPGLYSGALALVYPSHYEGFGLPVLEAMQCGTPVIASLAVAEVGGNAAIYAATPEEFAGAMLAVANSPDVRLERRARSLARAQEFSWDRTAHLTYEVYVEARRRFGR